MAVVTVVVHGLDALLAQLETYPERLATVSRQAMSDATLMAEGEIKPLTPRKTGRLFSAWTTSVKGTGLETVGVVRDNVSYGPFVEDDTAAHDIVAHGNALMLPVARAGQMVRGKATWGFGGGKLSGGARSGQQVAFFKRVRHPGTKGVHMARRGLEKAIPSIIRIFELAVSRALHGGI